MLNRKELFHRDLKGEEAKTENQAPAETGTSDPPVSTAAQTRNRLNNNIQSNENAQPRTIIGLPVRESDQPATRVLNRRSWVGERAQSSQGGRLQPRVKKDQSNTVKRVKGKALEIQNEKEVINEITKDHKSEPGLYREAHPKPKTKVLNEFLSSDELMKREQTKLNPKKEDGVLPGTSCYK